MHYIALDIGNVICEVDFTKFTSFLSKTLNLSIHEVWTRFNKYQRFQDIGISSIKDILQMEFNIYSEPLLYEIIDIWNNDVIFLDQHVIDYFEKLNADHDLQIALLSNIGRDHAAIMNRLLNIKKYRSNDLEKLYVEEDGAFKKAIRHFSCDVGVRKPQSLYYQSFLLQYPEFKGCLYLDDLQDNLDTAKKFGFDTVLFDLDKYKNVSSFAPIHYLEQLREKIIFGRYIKGEVKNGND